MHAKNIALVFFSYKNRSKFKNNENKRLNNNNRGELVEIMV